MRAECGEKSGENEDVDIDNGPVNLEDDEKVFNAKTETNSFVPTNIDSEKEK